ncbi:hypothetical protein RMATCC62417_04181 [Rhizopus microsporus]|nr:hypothetical protein RMATCC62417_04181 [Rhizopus microsporus]CEI95652.1 hypothetical protein RMCBS344292_09832 [Rhizopus microsporus]
MSANNDIAMPPHPGLDSLTDVDKLKHLCPAFSKGCPYAKLEELDSLAVNRGEVSRCPAFKQGCPFSNKSREEVMSLMAQIPTDHPTLNMSELPSCDEGITLVKMLNQFLQRTELEHLVTPESPKQPEPEVLENPELASAMREGTKVIHRAAETSVFTKRFLKGDINTDEYGRYINSLYFVYRYMEGLLEEYKEHPVVKLIYFPIELNRREALEKDLAFFYGPDRLEELTKPETMTPAVKNYVSAMRDACNQDPALLIAHSYSRYLGDLSGGQILAKRLKKHILKLDEKDGEWDSADGLNFYYFNNLGNQAEFKNFYRERLNAAKVTAKTRELIVTEAVKSFELNIALFDEIQELSEAGLLAVTSYKPDQQDEVVVALEEVDILQKNETDKIEPIKAEKRSKSTYIKWLTVTVAAVAIGTAVYRRYFKRN